MINNNQVIVKNFNTQLVIMLTYIFLVQTHTNVCSTNNVTKDYKSSTAKHTWMLFTSSLDPSRENFM